MVTFQHLLETQASCLSIQSLSAHGMSPGKPPDILDSPKLKLSVVLFLHPPYAPLCPLDEWHLPRIIQSINLGIALNFHTPCHSINLQVLWILLLNITQIHLGTGPILHQKTQITEAGMAPPNTVPPGRWQGVSTCQCCGGGMMGDAATEGRGQPSQDPLGRESRHRTELLTDSRLLYWEDLTTHTRRE